MTEGIETQRLNTRSADLAKETRSAVIATETPVPMYWVEGRMVDEVLLMSGCTLPRGKKMPLLDSHSRYSVDNQLGSFRNLRVENDQLVGDIEVSETRPDVRQKIDEGTIDSISVGYEVLKSTYLPEGKTKSFKGRELTGPLVVTEKWRPYEGSLVPVPADDLAKIRSDILKKIEIREINTGNESSGMVSDANGDRMEKEIIQETQNVPAPAVEQRSAVDVDAAVKAARDADKKFRANVRTQCERFGLGNQVEAICEKCDSIEDAQRMILDLVSERQKDHSPVHVVVTGEGKTQARQAVKELLVKRALSPLDLKKETKERHIKDIDSRYDRWGYSEMARFLLESNGVDCSYRSNEEMLREAVYGKRDDMNTPGQLSNLFADVANLTSQAAYADYQSSFELVMRQVESQPTLHDVHVAMMSGFSQLDAWPATGKEPIEKLLDDSKEKIVMVAYANNITIPWHSIKSDRIGFLSEIPFAAARAAKVTFNKAAWKVVTANAALSDSVALWHSTHRNTTGPTAGGPTSANVGLAVKGLRLQTANDGGLMGLTPAALVGPAAYERQIRQLCNSEYDPGASTSTAYNPYRGLMPVIEPELDASSAVTFYAWAEKMFSPIVFSYLQGEESPVIEQFIRQSDNSLVSKVRQTGAVGAVDYRGAYQFISS